MFADLHLHSTYSDGIDRPIELCRLAKAHNIQVISITDHDSVEGHKALLHMQVPQGLEIIKGIEISTLKNHKMQHILGFYIDIFDKKLEDFIKTISAEITESTRLNFERAVSDGVFSYQWERVLELNPTELRMGGTRVLRAMDIDNYKMPGEARDMYRKYFIPTNEDYIWHSTITGYDAIDIIKSVGGVPIIAHPKSIDNDDTVLDLIKYGAQGLEVYHPTHSNEDVAKYLQMAVDHKLYISGGSDWHGKDVVTGREMGRTGLAHADYDILKLRF